MKKSVYVCKECEHSESKWMGKCHQCQTWNSFEIQKPDTNLSSSTKNVFCISEKLVSKNIIKTSLDEFDRAFGGGLSVGSINLIGGEPGVGKSTLILQLLNALTSQNKRGLYLSGEESIEQIQARCLRLNIVSKEILIGFESNWDNIKKIIKKQSPEFLIIDSVQTLKSNELMNSLSGGGSTKTIIYELIEFVKSLNITVVLIGHVTKSGELAGPKFLEHMVDVVASLEKDGNSDLRVLRVFKNRFGGINEVGLFTMTQGGFVENKLNYLNKKLEPGVYTVTQIGSRNMLVEIQSLVGNSGERKRISQGYLIQRLLIMLAILNKYIPEIGAINHSALDIYLNLLDCLNKNEKICDLGVIYSLLFSLLNKKSDHKVLILGEVDLKGNTRPLPQNLRPNGCLDGFDKVIVPKQNLKEIMSSSKTRGVTYIGVKNISDLSAEIA